MLEQGTEALSDAEILALILGTSIRGAGGVLQMCRELLIQSDGLEGLSRRSPQELMQFTGIGKARACAIVAAIDLGRRLEGQWPILGNPIFCAADVYHRLKPKMVGLRQEVFWILGLDAKHRIQGIKQVAQGSATAVEVHPREVFGPLIREAATAVIVVHNHPSGDPEPSHHDKELTSRLKQAGQILGIPLLDHIIIGRGQYTSLADLGILD